VWWGGGLGGGTSSAGSEWGGKRSLARVPQGQRAVGARRARERGRIARTLAVGSRRMATPDIAWERDTSPLPRPSRAYRTLSTISFRNSSRLDLSIQRTTTTRSVAGSIQITLLPAPRAEKLRSGALGSAVRLVLSHQSRPYCGFNAHGRRISSIQACEMSRRSPHAPPRATSTPKRARSRV